MGKFEVVSEIQNVISVTFAKISATLFLLRLIAGASNKLERWSLYLLIVILITVAITYTTASLAQCNPIRAAWDPRVKGNCLHPNQVLGFAYGIGGMLQPREQRLSTNVLQMTLEKG